MLVWGYNEHYSLTSSLGQSAGAAEYNDCFFTERLESPNECPDSK